MKTQPNPRKARLGDVRCAAEGSGVASAPAFDLWLEFEHAQPQSDDFANVQVRLPDGRRYAMNVWTFGFLPQARFPWPYQEGVGDPAEYLLPPDLFVARLDRPTLERVVAQMLAAGEMRAEWLCPPEDLDAEPNGAADDGA